MRLTAIHKPEADKVVYIVVTTTTNVFCFTAGGMPPTTKHRTPFDKTVIMHVTTTTSILNFIAWGKVASTFSQNTSQSHLHGLIESCSVCCSRKHATGNKMQNGGGVDHQPVDSLVELGSVIRVVRDAVAVK